jgi:hypothetical protein
MLSSSVIGAALSCAPAAAIESNAQHTPANAPIRVNRFMLLTSLLHFL